MFNLEQSIANWRKEMLAAGIKAPVPLEELEAHLREEIERQIKLGMDEQQAFLRTVAHIGQAKELKTEFAKDRPLKRLLETELVKKEWELKWGPAAYFVLFTAILIFFCGLVILKPGNFSGATTLQQASCLAATTISWLLFNGGLLGYRFFPVIMSKRVRTAVTLFSAVVVSFSTLIFLALVNVRMEQFLPEFAWAFFVPFGALGSLILGLERAAQEKIEKAVS